MNADNTPDWKNNRPMIEMARLMEFLADRCGNSKRKTGELLRYSMVDSGWGCSERYVWGIVEKEIMGMEGVNI